MQRVVQVWVLGFFKASGKMSSEELVEVLLQTFWAVATAFTTDINWKTRDWLITKFNQAYFDKAKKHVEKLVVLDKKGGSDQVILESFRDDYESVLLQVAGKPVTRVKKPLWSDLERNVRATLIKLAHQAGNQNRDRFEDCFDYALYKQPSQGSRLKNVQARMQVEASATADDVFAFFESVDQRINTHKHLKKHKSANSHTGPAKRRDTDIQASQTGTDKRRDIDTQDLCDFFGSVGWQARVNRCWSQEHQQLQQPK